MYYRRRVVLFKPGINQIFEFNTGQEERAVLAQGWVENPADLEIEQIQESVGGEVDPSVEQTKPKVGRPKGVKNRRPSGNLGGRLL